jgi:hypothetical protein
VPGSVRAGLQDLCFRTCPRREAVKLPGTEPCLARSVSRRKGDRTASARQEGPRRPALAGPAAEPEGRTHSLFTMSNNTLGPEGQAMRQPAGPVANS